MAAGRVQNDSQSWLRLLILCTFFKCSYFMLSGADSTWACMILLVVSVINFEAFPSFTGSHQGGGLWRMGEEFKTNRLINYPGSFRYNFKPMAHIFRLWMSNEVKRRRASWALIENLWLDSRGTRVPKRLVNCQLHWFFLSKFIFKQTLATLTSTSCFFWWSQVATFKNFSFRFSTVSLFCLLVFHDLKTWKQIAWFKIKSWCFLFLPIEAAFLLVHISRLHVDHKLYKNKPSLLFNVSKRRKETRCFTIHIRETNYNPIN